MCSQSPALPDGKWMLSGSSCDTYPPSQYLLFYKGERLKEGRGNLGDEREKQEQKMTQKGCGFQTQGLNNRKWKQNKKLKAMGQRNMRNEIFNLKKKMFDDNKQQES